ncbi:MAG TPA: rhomboid family intramembrane serine protease [Gemmatimonadales bacterium]
MDSPSPFQLTPWVRRLLVANVIVYVLTISVFTGPWFTEMFAFSPLGAAERPWTFLTYMFVHAGFLHLAFSMLMLVFFGPGVERRMGGPAFARFFFLCGFGGPVLAFAMSLVVTVPPFVGAAAAVFGVALAFAMAWPNARVFVFPLPFPLPVKYLVAFLVTMDLIPLAARFDDGLAAFAHLGGLLFGLLYLKSEDMVDRHVRPAVLPDPETPVLVHHHLEAQAQAEDDAPASAAHGGPTLDEISEEMDRLLDKISERGLSSLTVAERRFLDDMSRQMREP